MTNLTRDIGDWVAQDDRVTAADQYRNVHDLQRFRRNWNALLARRFRQPCLVQSYTGNSGDVTFYGVEPVTATKPGDCFGPIMVPVPSQCQTLTLYMRAESLATNADVTLYPTAVGARNSVPGVYDSDFRFTVPGGSSIDDYSCSVRVNEAARKAGCGPLWLTFISAVDIAGGVFDTLNVLDSGPNWVTVDGGITPSGGGMAFQFDGAPELGVHGIRSAIPTGTGTDYKITLLRPFPTQPDNTDTMLTYQIGTALVYTLSIYPDRVTDFDAAEVDL